jgi:outer membrane protein assembly factor BamA
MLSGLRNSSDALQSIENASATQTTEDTSASCTQPEAKQAALIRAAERGKFTLRRIELTGNVSTPDDLLHRSIARRMKEGDLFNRYKLVASLRKVSKLRTIYPVTMKDIVVELNQAEKTLDVLICIKERSNSSEAPIDKR